MDKRITPDIIKKIMESMEKYEGSELEFDLKMAVGSRWRDELFSILLTEYLSNEQAPNA